MTHQYLLNYQNAFGKHNVSAMAGFEGYRLKYVYFYGDAQQLYKMGDFTLGNGTSQYSASGQQHKYNTAGFFFTANYNYDEKYLLSAVVRRDGSSRLSKNIRWATFPSVSLGWRFDKEKFFPISRDIVNMFKIRASYGELGNENIGEYQYMASMNRNNMTYSFGNSLVTVSYTHLTLPTT